MNEKTILRYIYILKWPRVLWIPFQICKIILPFHFYKVTFPLCDQKSSLPTWLFVHFRLSPHSYFRWTLTGGVHIMHIQPAQWWQMQRVRSRHIKNTVFLDSFPVIRHISTWNKSIDTSKCNKSSYKLISSFIPKPTPPVLCPTQFIPLLAS